MSEKKTKAPQMSAMEANRLNARAAVWNLLNDPEVEEDDTWLKVTLMQQDRATLIKWGEDADKFKDYLRLALEYKKAEKHYIATSQESS